MRNLKNYALYLLSKRDYGVKELERKLLLKGYEIEEVEDLLEYYISIGYLNDEKLIERLIFYQISKDKNKKQVEIYLFGKGFDNHLIKSHLEKINFYELEETMVQKQIVKYLESSKPITKEKIINRLLNKGYSYQSIKNHLEKHT
ncbi:MAG: RecX family transcriptional regulator [Firmicutes bacterium]|nr:RecX family transcriptional regulator [Bacillota bacterium]